MECIDAGGFTDVACDHAANPRNHGPLDRFDGHARITGPCGDTMEFWLTVKDGRVDRVSFETDGCGSSLACGSMATSLAEGRRIEEAAVLNQAEILEALGGCPPEFEHCALLAANTLTAACTDVLNRGRRQDESEEEFAERQRLEARMCRIRHKVIVLSGKGGVGKSTVAVNLAMSLVQSGKRVGLLDVDIHGPSIPTMLGLEGEEIHGSDEGMLPVELGEMKVMSLGFLLQGHDEAVIWRGPRKAGVIKQFLKDVAWGELDYLIIDAPPGTGDEPLSVCQIIDRLDGAVIVTTPQKVAAVDVRKSITFCRHLNVPVLGVVENMSGFACPKCGEVTHILCSGGGREMAEDMGVLFLGSIPIDPKIAEACDNGRSFVQCHSDSPSAAVMREAVRMIEDAISTGLSERQKGG
ncbi:MAG: P-loop NTPase [bacterium]